MLIFFSKTGIYVPLGMVHRYFIWALRSAFAARSLRVFLRGFWLPSWFRETPDQVDETLALAKSLGLVNGWVRWETDGSRRQVFDPWRSGICKIQKRGAFLDVRDEIELRSALGDLSPKILRQDSVHMAYVEEWVQSIPGNCSCDELERVRHILDDRLYRVEEKNTSEYIDENAISFSNAACNLIPSLVQRLGRETLPISTVHGDLVCSNIAFRGNGQPILYDWEYARTCVVTHDVWFYLYHRSLAKDSCSELPDFLNVFKSMIGWAFPAIQDVSALHLIHLFEREALLLSNSVFVDSDHALKRVHQSIEESLTFNNHGL